MNHIGVQHCIYDVVQFINIIHLIYCFRIYAAEDWLNPSAILEAFEARAIRMAVSSAQSLGDFPNPEEGDIFLIKLVLKLFSVCFFKNYEQNSYARK